MKSVNVGKKSIFCGVLMFLFALPCATGGSECRSFSGSVLFVFAVMALLQSGRNLLWRTIKRKTTQPLESGSAEPAFQTPPNA